MYYRNDHDEQTSHQNNLRFNPFKALIAPRPIGWISTIDSEGNVNLAPYSYFQAVADNPDIVLFSASSEIIQTNETVKFGKARKHSESNAILGGEFVCNLVNLNLKDQMNITSAHIPQGVSEAQIAGLELTKSKYVSPPRVKNAPAALECIVVDSHPVKHRKGEHIFHLVFGEVINTYIDDQYVKEGKIDTVAMSLVTRMGYDEYTVTNSSFAMTRPDFDPLQSGLLNHQNLEPNKTMTSGENIE